MKTLNIGRTGLAAALGIAALTAGLPSSAGGAMAVDSDAVLHLSCDTASFGANLATADDRLTLIEQRNAVLKAAPEELATLRDGMDGTDESNGGFVYGAWPSGDRAPIAARWSGAASYCDGDFTFECFIRIDADASFENGSYVIRHSGAWMIQVSEEGVPVWKNKDWGQNINPPSIKDGKWHHLAVVQDRTLGTFAYYLDYALVGAAKYVVPAGSADSTLEVNCGYGLNNWSISGAAYDEVRIVKRALTPQEFVMPPAWAEAFLADAAARAESRRTVVSDDTLVYAPCDEEFLTGGSEMNALAPADGKPALTLLLNATDAVLPASAAAATLSPFYETSFTDAEAHPNASCLTLTDKGRMVMADTSYLNDDFTLEFFFRATADDTSAWEGNYVYLVHQHGGFYFRIDKDGPGKVACNAAGTEVRTEDTAYADGEWHHYAIVYEKAKRSLRLYIDRERIVVKALTDDLANVVTADAPLYIGTSWWTSGTAFMVNRGSYDEIRLTKRALRAVEFLSPERSPVFRETKAYLNFDNGVSPSAMRPLVEAATVTDKVYAKTFAAESDDVAAAAFRATARGMEPFANAAALHADLDSADSHVGAGGGYVVADPDGDFSTGSWTAEMFFKVAGPSKYYSKLLLCPNSWAAELSNGGGEYLKLRGGVGNAEGKWTVGEWTRSVGDGEWHHLAVVGDADAKTVSFYLDYALFTRFENAADPLTAGAARPTELYLLCSNTNQYCATMGPKEGWYDEIRLTKRALAVTEFVTREGETLDAASLRLDARFEDGWASSAETGNYAASILASSDGAATATGGRVSREILNASGEAVLTSRRGAVLTGGTVAYAGQGLFDETAATCEVFVRREAGGADDAVVAFAKGTDAARAFWKLTADGTFEVAGQDAMFPKVALDDGAWHHLAVAYETAGGIVSVTLYWDHELVATRTAAAFEFGTGAGLVFGSSGFSGRFDEARLHPLALGPEDLLYATPPRGLRLIIR